MPGLPARPVAAALRLPLLLAVRRPTITSPRLPLPPLPCLLPTRLAAIAGHRLLGPEGLLTALQQTPPRSRSASRALSALPRRGPLILERICRIFRRAHGRWCSQKLMPRRGTSLLSGALPIADSLAPPRTHQSVPLSTILTLPQNSVTEIHSLIVVPSSPPSSLGGIVPTHPAIMDPSSPPLTLLVRGKERNSLTIRKSQ